jgi:hypothetical protein
MLFLGLGTGLGSALIVDGVLEPLDWPPSLQERLSDVAPATIAVDNAAAREGGFSLWH